MYKHHIHIIDIYEQMYCKKKKKKAVLFFKSYSTVIAVFLTYREISVDVSAIMLHLHKNLNWPSLAP